MFAASKQIKAIESKLTGFSHTMYHKVEIIHSIFSAATKQKTLSALIFDLNTETGITYSYCLCSPNNQFCCLNLILLKKKECQLCRSL